MDWVAGVWVDENGVRKAGHIPYYKIPCTKRREFWLEVADMLEVLADEIRSFWEMEASEYEQ